MQGGWGPGLWSSVGTAPRTGPCIVQPRTYLGALIMILATLFSLAFPRSLQLRTPDTPVPTRTVAQISLLVALALLLAYQALSAPSDTGYTTSGTASLNATASDMTGIADVIGKHVVGGVALSIKYGRLPPITPGTTLRPAQVRARPARYRSALARIVRACRAVARLLPAPARLLHAAGCSMRCGPLQLESLLSWQYKTPVQALPHIVPCPPPIPDPPLTGHTRPRGALPVCRPAAL